MKIAVLGLWHLGCVTAACLAHGGHDVVASDPDPAQVEALAAGRPPIEEPGLPELIAAGRRSGKLTFVSDPAAAVASAEVLWVTLDTPVDDEDEADTETVRKALDMAAAALRPGALVVVSSQVPVGFTRDAARAWTTRQLAFAYIPENLQLGRAIDAFLRPERIVASTIDAEARAIVARLLQPFGAAIEWMTVESAEMTKHALNAFLATSIAFTNEIARIGVKVGADARQVERGLRSDPRIGPRAYVSPGPAFAGGTLARDVRYLLRFGARDGVATSLLEGVLRSNERHLIAQREQILALLTAPDATVAVLGLTYKPGTSTLRRSASVQLCRDLHTAGASVRVHDPAVPTVPPELAATVHLFPSAELAIAGADVAVVATAWAEYKELTPDAIVSRMRRPCVVDPGRFLEGSLAADVRIIYLGTGRPKEIRD